MPAEVVLTLSCPDRPGIVAAVAAALASTGANIADSQQFGDPSTGLFFMRVHASAPDAAAADVEAALAPVAAEFGMSWGLHDLARRPSMLVLVSKFGHCLNDLLFRVRTGHLEVDIPAVVSNHDEYRALVESYGIPFHHLPVTPETKAAQEQQILDLAKLTGADLVVLARYMQVLSPEMCAALDGRAINIHHSFLPSFKGAAPYQQAYARGVKLIGATAHYVTANLDEGPIIEQEVARVDHSMGPKELSAVGRDLECVALARAVRWHLEHRVLLNGSKTVVFR
ncbi:MAG: formyltetrahydrofolate deformylase [Actinomycetales bacterium]